MLPPAQAGIEGEGNTITVSGSRSSSDDAAHVTPPGKPSKKPGPRVIERGKGDRPPVPSLVYRPDFGTCATRGGVYWKTDPHDVSETYPACPPLPGSPRAAAPPRPSPLEAAYQAWYWETKLPSPSLATSPPDGAITGLDLYLSIGGPQTMTLDVPALGYTVHLEVTSTYDVDWGDPRPDGSATGQAVTRNHPTQGGPYPHGDLRHQYIDRGEVTIEVTQRWTATWSADGRSGTIADRLATSATRTVPVREIQAVLLP